MGLFSTDAPRDNGNDSDNTLLFKIANFLYRAFGFGGTPPTGGIVVTPQSGTLSTFAKTAGQTETIPVGAFQIGVIILTGTGTVGGVDLPVGVPWNCEAKLAATVAVVCGSPGTARVSYLL